VQLECQTIKIRCRRGFS